MLGNIGVLRCSPHGQRMDVYVHGTLNLLSNITHNLWI